MTFKRSDDIQLHKLPPQNIEAEQMVLGAILIDNDSLDSVMDLLVSADFYKDAHKTIYGVMVSMFEARQAIDLVTLTDALRVGSRIEKMGGASYLSMLVSLVPTSASIKYHARIVREKSILRQLLHASIDIQTQCYDDSRKVESVDDLLDHAEGLVFGIAQKKTVEAFHSAGSLMPAAYVTIQRVYENKGSVTGLATGFVDLDKKLSGLQPQDLIIVAGRPSMGKTALCLNIASFVAVENNKSTAFFSLEMSKEQLMLRLISSESRVDSHKLRTGYIEERDWSRLAMAREKIGNAPLYIDDTASLPVLDLRAKARRIQADKGLDLIIVDYLQLMRGRGDADNREQEVASISRSLKALAKELNVPVIALSQLNRAVETRGRDKRPMLSDLRESGAVEQDSDVILFIYREEVYQKCECPEDLSCGCGRKGKAEVIIGKQRNGPIGIVPLTYNGSCTRFDNAARTPF